MKTKNLDFKSTLMARGSSPLLCWDIVSMHFMNSGLSTKNDNDLATLLKYQLEYNWKIDLQAILNTFYDALVLTDTGVNIQWVNSGFSHMTGYPKEEVIGRNPRMLQGESTTPTSRSRLRKNMQKNKHFTQTLVNYRKNGEPYHCRLDIHPLFNEQHAISHFLALEREIK